MTASARSLEKEAPIFIVGAKRGGTTLFRRVIDAHPRITIPPPGWLFHFIYPYLYSYGDLSLRDNFVELVGDCLSVPMIRDYWTIGLSAEEIADRAPESSFRGAFFALTEAYSRNKDSGPLWGSKSPGEVFWIREMKQEFPGARFLFLLRDGRDVAADLMSTIWGPRSAYTAALNWRRHMEAILAAQETLPQDCYSAVRYEDFVTQPEEKLREVCAFLDLDYAPQMLDYHKNPADSFVTSSYHAKTNQPITDCFVGIHRSLPDDDRQAIAAATGDLLERLGYPAADSTREIGFWENLRNTEADDHGGMMLRGGVELMDELRKRRFESFKAGRWSAEDRREFLRRTS